MKKKEQEKKNGGSNMPRPHTPIPCTQTHPGAPNAPQKQPGVLTLVKVSKQQNSERATTHSGRGTPGRALPARERRMGAMGVFCRAREGGTGNDENAGSQATDMGQTSLM